MDYYFNKTLNFQKLYQEDLNKIANNLHVQKTLPKSKSSNELIAKKQEKENPSNTIFLNTWGFNKTGQLANSSSVLKTSQLNLIKNPNDKPIYVSAGENHTAILTNKLKLYVSGANSFGQLGIEDIVNTLKPTLIPALSQIEIISVSCGADFTYAMSSKGEVFSWGSNFKGQLGQGDYENRTSPSLVHSLAPFGMVSSKMNKNMQASHKRNKSSNINAYIKFREKSHSVDFNNINDPILKKMDETKALLDEDERVHSISCGALHTLVKTDKNKLFSCGFGETYALGNGETRNLTEFEPVTFMKTNTSRPNYQKAEEIEKIACGLTHSGCIRNGKVYIWGLYSHRESSALKIPTLVEFSASAGRRVESEYFIDIALGDTLSVFLNSKGEVYTLGENIDGQLGIPNVTSTDYPMKVNHLPIAVNQIACGRNHVFALNTESKQVYAWGSNLFGQLSLKNKGQSLYTPKQISALCEMDILKITCGSFHTLALSNMPSPVDLEENDLFSDDEKTVPSLTSTTIDLQKYQEEIDKLRNEVDKLKSKNHYLSLENEKLKSDTLNQTKSDFLPKGLKRTGCDVAIQVNFEERKDDGKHRNRRDKSPEPKPQRVLHPQVEIDFKEITLEKQISEGGYGLIYKGRWRETVVAVKMLKIDMKEEHIRDFIYECYTMESLRHPNVVMFLGACTKPPNLAIVLEYCSRGSLWSALQNPDLKLSWEDRRRMAVDTAKGVNYLHSFPTPVLHRDLKSLNLLLDENFRIKVADFGWTRTMASTMTGKIGTYQWMAPEVISGHNYTEKADVFSFGIVLWEIASREPPYRNINGLQVSIEVVQNDLRPTIPKKTPEAFSRLMRKCWDRDPNKRPSFVEIIKELETMKFEY